MTNEPWTCVQCGAPTTLVKETIDGEHIIKVCGCTTCHGKRVVPNGDPEQL